MNENLNLVEILKDCPKGTKLYYTVYGEVEFEHIANSSKYPIVLKLKDREWYESLTSEGKLDIEHDGECLLFPSREERDWSKFNPKKGGLVSTCEFKDGDILATNSGLQVFVLRRQKGDKEGSCYIGYDFELNDIFFDGERKFSRLATEEEKQKLFQALKDNGYELNTETKILKKLIKPSFHEGDWVADNCGYVWKIEGILNQFYLLEGVEGGESRPTIDLVDKTFHLWTIRDAKNGDVLACNEEILLFKSYLVSQGRISLYCWYNGHTNNFHSKEVIDILLTTRNKVCPAVKEQCDALMKAMNDAGYEWDSDKKELKKLVHNKFDPKTLMAFDKVLVRYNNTDYWRCDFFSHELDGEGVYKYACIKSVYKRCIPYNDETKHLLGTSDEAHEYYRYWED